MTTDDVTHLRALLAERNAQLDEAKRWLEYAATHRGFDFDFDTWAAGVEKVLGRPPKYLYVVNQRAEKAEALLADATARAERAEARADVAEAEIAAIISALHGPTMRPLAELVRDYVKECGRLGAVVGYVTAWTHVYGASLKPPGADTYGEGKRDAKNEVAAILRGKA